MRAAACAPPPFPTPGIEMRTFCARVAAAVLGLTILLAAATPHARAQAYEDALKGFATDSFGDTDTAITGVATSGHELAARVIAALQSGRLLFDPAKKTIYVREPAGLVDATTGKVASGVDAGVLKAVRLNNRLRRSIDAALGGLSLLGANPDRRFEAAQSVFRARDVNALKALDTAIAKEPEPRVRTAMLQARAAIVLTQPATSDADKLDAIKIVRERNDQDARALLGGLPAGLAQPVQAAASDAIDAIDSYLARWRMVQNLWYGISLGSVLLLAAIGLAITFGVMGVINMAHGEMVMLGAYTTFVVQEVIRGSAPWMFDYSLAIAIPVAFVVAGLVGIAIERGVIRFLYGRPLETLLATWGISLILQQAVRTMFGPNNREVGTPAFMSGVVEFGGLAITLNRFYIIIFSAIVFAALLAALRYTTLGLHMRAVTQNRRMASAMAINTGRIDALTFGLGSGIAGLAGVALSQIDNVSPNLGQSYIIDSFLVVVFGGVGNLWGTLVGALTLGIANKFLEPYAGAVLGKIALLVLVILFIQKRPRGLFALKGRAVEA
jgi:urea transport system permease protein